MCVLVRKSQVGMLLTAWWMFMAVISLGALQTQMQPRNDFKRNRNTTLRYLSVWDSLWFVAFSEHADMFSF